MVARLKPQEVQVMTQDGECKLSISIDLNINLNSNGITATVNTKEEEIEEKSRFEIPDFEPSNDRINFGRKV